MNTAGRLLAVVEALNFKIHRDTSDPMVKVWATVLELDVADPALEDSVVTCLQAMREELDLLSTKLTALEVPPDCCNWPIKRLRDVASTVHLNSNWYTVRDEILKPDTRMGFMWANWVLRGEDEESMPSEELASLRSELDALEQSLRDTDMTPYLRGFIQRQIDAIRTALKLYRVQGVKPIEEALHQVAGAYTIEKTRVEAAQAQASEPAKGVFARAGAMIKKVAETADNLDKIRKAGEGAYTLAASVGPLLVSWVQSLPKP